MITNPEMPMKSPVLLLHTVCVSTYCLQIPVGDFSKDPNIKQYVYLQAQFPGRLLEKIVLVSFQSGYIFIQTDKTLYTPNSKSEFSTPSVLKQTALKIPRERL